MGLNLMVVSGEFEKIAFILKLIKRYEKIYCPITVASLSFMGAKNEAE